MSSMTKGETLGIQRRMAAKRARDKATRTKRVRSVVMWIPATCLGFVWQMCSNG